MKFLHLAFLPLLLAVAPMASAFGPIDLAIDQSYKTDSDKKSETQSKSLKITLTNNSRQDLAGLKVKYYFFARDLTSRNISIAAKGEKTADVKAVAKTLVETDVATAKVNKNKKGDTGEKIFGYALRVFDSTDKLLIERYEPLSLQQELAKTDPLPK